MMLYRPKAAIPVALRRYISLITPAPTGQSGKKLTRIIFPK